MPQRMRTLDPKASALAFFGSRLRFWRKVRGLSQAEVGRLVHVSGALIGKLEKADRRPGTDLARQLDAALDAANELVTLERQLVSATRPSEPAGDDRWLLELPEPRAPMDPEWAPGAFGPDQELLLRIAEIAASCGIGRDAEVGQLGEADVRRLESITALYRSLDYERGGGLLRREVAGLAESATRLLSGRYRDDVGVQLQSAVAGTHQLAGWTAFDAGDREAALRHWQAAELSALAAGDHLLLARIGYCQARLEQHWHRPAAALDRLRQTRSDVGGALTPGVETMLTGLEATLWSELGEPAPALSALDRSAEAFGRLVPAQEPVWMAFYGRAELMAQFGRVHRDLGRGNWSHGVDAMEWLTRSITAFGPADLRSKVFNEVLLASALFVAGDPDSGMRIGWQAITHAQDLTSRRVLDRVVELRRDLQPFRSRPDVVDFARALCAVRDAVRV